MARPNKQGLDYFPFDVDFFDDEKIEAISGEFGIKGEITAIKLLCAIYRNGYFILWSDMLKMKLLKNLPGISSELLDAILDRLVLWDFFDKSLFDSMGVLTSKGIQKRFFSIVKRRNKNEDYPYLLVSVCNNEVSVCNNSSETELLSTKSTQRKEKEKKEKNNPLLSPDGDIPPGENYSIKKDDNPVDLNQQNRKKEKSCAKKERKVFVPPSVDEVGKFCKENGYTISPWKFVNYYTSNGWMVGRNKMKDWKAAVRTWQSKENNYGERQLPASNQIGTGRSAGNSSGNDAANKRAELDNLEKLAEAVLRGSPPTFG